MNFCRARRGVNFYLMQPFLFFPPFLSFPLLFSCRWTQPWLFIVYDSISNLSSRSIFLVGSAVLLFPFVCATVALGIHVCLCDSRISISNSASARIRVWKVTLTRQSLSHVWITASWGETCWNMHHQHILFFVRAQDDQGSRLWELKVIDWWKPYAAKYRGIQTSNKEI